MNLPSKHLSMGQMLLQAIADNTIVLDDDTLGYKWEASLENYESQKAELDRAFAKFDIQKVKKLSHQDRADAGAESSTLSYAEIDYRDFGMLLLDLQDWEFPQNAHYYDLGSGVVSCVKRMILS
jgi:hypothetical protein